jgi:putative (di)nucleoside polyphosphate hydrolase
VDYWQPVREVIYFKRSVYARALHELAHMMPGGPPPYPAWWRRGAISVPEEQLAQ